MKKMIMICVITSMTLPLWAGDWPQFRGPNRDGVSLEKGLAAAWPADGPKQNWKVAIGQGFSTIAVVGNQLYTMFSEGEQEFLGCYNADSGKEQWRLAIGEKFVDSFGDGPRSGPIVDGSMIYALGSKGDLHAVNRKTGKTIWHKPLAGDEFKGKVARWGYSMSPLIDGDLLLVEVGGGAEKGMAGFNKADGELKWIAYTGETGYSSPVMTDFDGKRYYIFIATLPGAENQPPTQRLVAFSKTGEVLMEQDVPGFCVAMPVMVGKDKVFVSASNDDGGRLFQMKSEDGKTPLTELWATRNMKNHFNSSIYHDGAIYGFSNATLTCLDASTGERKWAKRGLGKGSLILVEDRLIALSDKGRLVMFEATGEAYKEKSACQPLTGKSWTSPTIADGNLYLRNQEEMVSLSLK